MNVSTQGINKIDFTANGQKFSFKMTYDADNPCDRDMLSEFGSLGVPEPEVVLAMQRIVRVGDTVIDGGANIGFFTVYLAQLVGPSGKVIAVEPGQNNLWKLEENVRINKIKNVEIVRQPLWSQHRLMTFYMRHEGGRNSLFGGEHRGAVPLTTCTLADLPPSRLIKLDIEGAECAALECWEGEGFVIAEMNELALKMMGSDQAKMRANAETFLLRNDGELPIYVPPSVNILTNRQNTNVLLSTVERVAEVWREVRV